MYRVSLKKKMYYATKGGCIRFAAISQPNKSFNHSQPALHISCSVVILGVQSGPDESKTLWHFKNQAKAQSGQNVREQSAMY